MGFIIYDIVFLVLSLLALGIFFFKRRSNFKIDGPLYLYRTKVGLKFIEQTSKKYSSLLKPLQYVILISGYLLMIGGIWLIVKLAYVYMSSPNLAKLLKVPVIFPLVPYLPEIFKIDFLPPFYFTYWVIIIALIALPHEFAHGIYARFHNMKVHSTGFGFLRLFKMPLPFLAAFVEPDEKQMQKMKKFPQLVMIAAGTFANIIVTILFIVLMWMFISLAFVPSGVNFNVFPTKIINLSDVQMINNFSIENRMQIESLLTSRPVYITSNNETYLARSVISVGDNADAFEVFENSPAFKANLSNTILRIDGKTMTSYDQLRSTILSHTPGDEIIVVTLEGKKEKTNYLTLAEKDGNPYLGIGVLPARTSGVFGWFYTISTKIQDPLVYYKSRIGDLGIFIKELFWWIIIVSFSVALMNMLPLGIFDGGKFFFLTILGITGNEKISEGAFKISTFVLLAIFALLMVKWLFTLF